MTASVVFLQSDSSETDHSVNAHILLLHKCFCHTQYSVLIQLLWYCYNDNLHSSQTLHAKYGFAETKFKKLKILTYRVFTNIHPTRICTRVICKAGIEESVEYCTKGED